MIRLPYLRVMLETVPKSGTWNMAVDEALLESAISSNTATLRLYQWNEPTVSLGYFQKRADFTTDPSLSKLPYVRRLSGGGAIVHDDELTYSIALPSSQRLFAKPEQMYDIVHLSMADSLQELAIPVSLRGETLKRLEEPLLCFQRQDSHDLILGGIKILGSAQRRRRGAILQHGSLIRRKSPAAPHLPGISDLCSSDIPQDLAMKLASRLADKLSDRWKFAELSENETAVTENILLRARSEQMEDHRS